jgi:hypothetical protein
MLLTKSSNRIIDAPPCLRKFLEARAKHVASSAELELLARAAADEAARLNNRNEALPGAKLALVFDRDRD